MKLFFAYSIRGSLKNTGFNALKGLISALQQPRFSLITTHQTENKIHRYRRLHQKSKEILRKDYDLII